MTAKELARTTIYSIREVEAMLARFEAHGVAKALAEDAILNQVAYRILWLLDDEQRRRPAPPEPKEP